MTDSEPNGVRIDPSTGTVEVFDSDGRAVDLPDGPVADALRALQRVTAALSVVTAGVALGTDNVDRRAAEAAAAVADAPLSANVGNWARTFAMGMRRADSDVPLWDEMSRSQQNAVRSGIRALLDDGYCIVPEELVRWARGAGKQLDELERQLEAGKTSR